LEKKLAQEDVANFEGRDVRKPLEKAAHCIRGERDDDWNRGSKELKSSLQNISGFIIIIIII
jgi:hypothetical protein